MADYLTHSQKLSMARQEFLKVSGDNINEPISWEQSSIYKVSLNVFDRIPLQF